MKPGDVFCLRPSVSKRAKRPREKFAKAVASLGDVYINDASGPPTKAAQSPAHEVLRGGGRVLMRKESVYLEARSPPHAAICGDFGGGQSLRKIGVIENLGKRGQGTSRRQASPI